MMKIKIFEGNSVTSIETKINNFINQECLSINADTSKFNIIDIKLSSTANAQGRKSILVLVIYEIIENCRSLI